MIHQLSFAPIYLLCLPSVTEMTDEYFTALRDTYQFCIQMKGNGTLQDINIILRQLNAICIGWTILYLNDQLGKYK